MGCDIHFYVEKRDEIGRWVSADKWVPSEYEEDKGRLEVPYAERFYNGRNYDLFAILADVRNGSGFAGVDTGDGFVPIAQPRGLPADVTPLVAADSERWGSDGHSHSHFTLAELLAYNWTLTTKHRGFVTAEQFERWNRWARENGEGPQSWCGGVGGGGTRIVGNEEMAALIAASQKIKPRTDFTELGSLYTQIEWEEPYHKSAAGFWSSTIPKLLRVSPGQPTWTRVVFWFDN